MPTSKRGWSNWAQTTSCEHLLRISLSKLDSQHFWDLMDCIPEESIDQIELEILQNVLKHYPLEQDTILYDTTNFYTFIDSSNDRCDIAQRAKNKQKRNDLRQVGLALAVTQKDCIPIIHSTYQGNLNDSKVFTKLISSIKKRMKYLNMDIEKHTIVFDRGCNSKKNMQKVKRLKLHYVGALTPYHHPELIKTADENFIDIEFRNSTLGIYRDKREIWGEKRTVIVFVSERLKSGQLRGIYQTLGKKKKKLRKIQRGLSNPKAKKRTKEQIEKTLEKALKGQYMEGLIHYEIEEIEKGRWTLKYRTDKDNLDKLEDRLGFRIIMTDRHDWESEKIIQAYYGQAYVESAFKNIKNPYHLAVTPGFHWTDQKIKIHYFTCVLGYLLSTLIWYEVKKTGFNGSLDTLLDNLNNIRLTNILELTGKKGKPKSSYKLETMTEEQEQLMNQLNLTGIHQKPLKIKGVSVYN